MSIFETIHAGGDVRILNLLPSPQHLINAVPSFDAADELPESELVEFNEWNPLIKIKDQNGKGACNGHAAALVAELTRNYRGSEHTPLSAWWIYSILCGGIDRGSNILDALKLCTDTGISPEQFVEYKLINPRKLTDDAKKAAPRFKIQVGHSCTTWKQVVSNVMLRRPMNLSIRVGNSFNNIDGEGAPGVGRGPGNHAVTVSSGLKKSSKWGWLVKMPNSWGTGWGQDGFCWLAEAHIEGGSYFECYTIDVFSEDPNEVRPAPVA